MRHRHSRWMLSKAFSKSTWFIYNCLGRSVHCSMMLRWVKIWSIHPRPFLKPACSSVSCWSTASEIRLMMSLARILLGTDRRVNPLHLLQLLRAPFFGIFTMTASVQPSSSCFSSHIVAKSGWRTCAANSASALKSSALRLSFPVDFHFWGI